MFKLRRLQRGLFLQLHDLSNPNLWFNYNVNVNQGPNPYDSPFSSLFVPHTTIWENANFGDLLLETDSGFRMSRSCLLQHPNLVASKSQVLELLYLLAGSFGESSKAWAPHAHQADETGSLFYRCRY